MIIAMTTIITIITIVIIVITSAIVIRIHSGSNCPFKAHQAVLTSPPRPESRDPSPATRVAPPRRAHHLAVRTSVRTTSPCSPPRSAHLCAHHLAVLTTNMPAKKLTNRERNRNHANKQKAKKQLEKQRKKFIAKQKVLLTTFTKYGTALSRLCQQTHWTCTQLYYLYLQLNDTPDMFNLAPPQGYRRRRKPAMRTAPPRRRMIADGLNKVMMPLPLLNK